MKLLVILQINTKQVANITFWIRKTEIVFYYKMYFSIYLQLQKTLFSWSDFVNEGEMHKASINLH